MVMVVMVAVVGGMVCACVCECICMYMCVFRGNIQVRQRSPRSHVSSN